MEPDLGDRVLRWWRMAALLPILSRHGGAFWGTVTRELPMFSEHLLIQVLSLSRQLVGLFVCLFVVCLSCSLPQVFLLTEHIFASVRLVCV